MLNFLEVLMRMLVENSIFFFFFFFGVLVLSDIIIILYSMTTVVLWGCMCVWVHPLYLIFIGRSGSLYILAIPLLHHYQSIKHVPLWFHTMYFIKDIVISYQVLYKRNRIATSSSCQCLCWLKELLIPC